MEVLYGLHPVEEAIRSGARALDQVLVARDRKDERLEKIIALCRVAGIRVSSESREQLTRLAKTEMHQGILAMVRERQFLGIEDLLRKQAAGAKDAVGAKGSAAPKQSESARRYKFFLALDGVEDPHNLGALLRTADAVAVGGVLIPERRSAPNDMASILSTRKLFPSSRGPDPRASTEASGRTYATASGFVSTPRTRTPRAPDRTGSGRRRTRHPAPASSAKYSRAATGRRDRCRCSQTVGEAAHPAAFAPVCDPTALAFSRSITSGGTSAVTSPPS